MGNRFRYILFFVFCMFLFPLFTRAECSYERVSDLSKMASNVQVSYTYELGYQIEYDVHITNLTNDLYATDNIGNTIDNNDTTLHYAYDEEKLFHPGDTISYEIYSNDANCKDEYLMTKYITLPDYNHFALSDECKKYPNFKYCTLWNYTNIGYKSFHEELEKYIASLNNDYSEESDNSNHSWFLFKNYYVIVVFVALLLVISLFFFKRRRKM